MFDEERARQSIVFDVEWNCNVAYHFEGGIVGRKDFGEENAIIVQGMGGLLFFW